MLQLISADPWHFTQPELSLRWFDIHTSIKQGSGLALTPAVIGKDHGHMLIKSAQHSLLVRAKDYKFVMYS